MKILVPVDFSELSILTLKTAAQIARKHPACSLSIVHVYEQPYTADISYSGQASTISVNKEASKIMKEQITGNIQSLLELEELQGLKVHTHVFADIKVQDILTHPKLEEQDLVIMATNGISGVKNLFLGSNTRKMMRSSKIPVLTIKNNTDINSLKKAVFVSDFNENIDGVIEKLKPITTFFNLELTLLKIITPTNFEPSIVSQKAIKSYLPKFNGNPNFEVFNAVSIEGGVREYAIENNVDLICMATHGRTGFDHLLFGSISEDMTEDLDFPFLSIKI